MPTGWESSFRLRSQWTPSSRKAGGALSERMPVYPVTLFEYGRLYWWRIIDSGSHFDVQVFDAPQSSAHRPGSRAKATVVVNDLRAYREGAKLDVTFG